MNARFSVPTKAMLDYALVFDQMLQSIFIPNPGCIGCGRALLEKGMCDTCRAAQEQDEIEQAISEGRY